ncbi:MAG: prephenate dehydrogenase/arogenate dehydrogenase family protein [Clostridiales bacterium]|nr:prephenate dehydrogenase/arogenate dehydrogenase family protein [Clostridiales bacterium]
MTFSKIGFIGLGLIGGSIAKRLKVLWPELTIVALASHETTITKAYEEHLISNKKSCAIEDFFDCDYLFLCAPVQKNIEYLRELKGNIKDSCIITDVGSVKTDIHREITALGMEEQFIGGHPMTGSEKTGLDNANAFLLENAYYIITPTAVTAEKTLHAFHELVIALGAIPMILPYELHDYATAAISHLPHVIAYSLVNLIRNCDDENETMKTIAAGGFKDITRIASSSPIMWENICLSNRDPLLKLLDAYVEELRRMRRHIDNADGSALLEAFHAAKDYRDSLSLTKPGALKNIYELYLDLLDEAGGIATVATILASNHLSIKNIGIIHNREFEEGVLHLEMYDEASLASAIALLKKHHYTIYER